MRLEARSSCPPPSTSTSTPISISTTTTTTTPPSTSLHYSSDKPWFRARRQTDPFTRTTSIPDLARPARHSADSSPRAATTDDYFGRAVPRTTSFSQSSTIISSEGLSNPALAGFTPRKINALKDQATPTCNNPTLLPTLTPTRSFPSSLPTLKVSPTTVSRDEPDNDNDHHDVNENGCVSPSAQAAANSYSKLQSALSGSGEPRSPHQKRAPASRSSYGIETSSGPPPALITQRTLSQDKLWRSNNPLETVNANKSPSQSPEPPSDAPNHSFSIDAVLNSESSTTPTPDKRSSPPLEHNRIETEEKGEMSSMETRNGRNSYGYDRDRTIRGSDYINTEASSRDSSNEETASKNEDLFLNIAKSTSDRRESTAGRNERRRSKMGIPTFSSRTIRASEQTPSPEQTRCADHTTPLQSQNASPSVQYNSANKPSPITAHPLDEVGRLRYFGVSPRTSTGYTRSRLNRTSRETSPEPQQSYVERSSQSVVQDSAPARGYQQSNLSTSRSRRHQSFSEAGQGAQEPEKSRLEGTESTLSTTAPSTVWDELDDLKSRIRKLELTGLLPTSSAAAMSHVSNERPRTATTTVTTMSSSPKHGRKAASPPPETSESGSAFNQIRPLLQSALEKAKPILNKDVYKALEATATDALALANMLGSNAPQSSGTSVVSGSGNSERQARRKADSMCRSLTELCLALSDEKLISLPNQRPGSRDTTSHKQQADGVETESSTPTISYGRSASHEPEEMRWSQNNRTSGQLESRRASRLSINTTAGSRLSQETNRTIPTPTHSTPPNRLSRTSTTLRTRRGQGEDESDDRQSYISRPLSRAMTELGNSGTPNQRFSPRDRKSLQNKQTPEDQTRNPSLAQSALPLRRNYVSPSTQLPAASHSNIQPGFRRYGGASASSTPGQAANGSPYDGPSDDSPLQQRTQLRGASSASRTAGRVSDIQPLRSRTNSVGTRRFGLRSRQVTMNMDGRDGISAGNAE